MIKSFIAALPKTKNIPNLFPVCINFNSLFKLVLASIVLLGSLMSPAKPMVLTAKEFKNPPSRIIRSCCSFGANLHLMVIPAIKISDITSIEKVGPHMYLGSNREGNGVIYTKRGGFIDLGHLRDQADWTAFLYSTILFNKEKGNVKLNLGIEGGKKSVNIKWDKDMDSLDLLHLAGKVTYDLSVWHEIGTWYGTSYVPLMPERYSSFSIEDIYSNLTGVTLGMEALKSNMPYEQAMTHLLASKLNELEAVKTEKETYDAYEATRNIWWSRDYRLPSRKILLKHQCEAYPGAKPWLVPNKGDTIAPYCLTLIDKTTSGESLNDFYEFKIKLNVKLLEKKNIKKLNKRVITQNDFMSILKGIELEMAEEFKS